MGIAEQRRTVGVGGRAAVGANASPGLGQGSGVAWGVSAGGLEHAPGLSSATSRALPAKSLPRLWNTRLVLPLHLCQRQGPAESSACGRDGVL